jgi:SsrA-binding protein
MAREEKTISKNKKAFHEFFIEDRYDAGLVLTGVEVKSLRENGASLRECFALVRGGEAWLHGLHISPYSHGNRENIDLDRPRKLLLHKQEIRELASHWSRCASTSTSTTWPRSSSASPKARSCTTSAPASRRRT